jgi:uncharacterized protein (DUF2336 family)
VRADAPLLSTLDHIVKHGSRDRRAEILKRVTNLYIEGASDFTDRQVEFFDDVFNRLIIEIEARARFELSLSLAAITNAPRCVVRRLANDGNASVARPVLEHSLCLEDDDLIAVARSKSQQHLLAISSRSQLAEVITDVLVRRGNREVMRSVAGNLGARLSADGFSILVRKAEKDGILAEKVGMRDDIPEPLVRELFMQAAHVVQKRLFATATQENRTRIQRVLADISKEYGVHAPPGGAVINIASEQSQSISKINENAIAKWASEGNHKETIRGLAKLCKIPIDKMNRIMANKSTESVLVVCKALDFGWQTARALILLQTAGLGMPAHSLETKSRNFEKLSISGCQEVMRLWCTMRGRDHAEEPIGEGQVVPTL